MLAAFYSKSPKKNDAYALLTWAVRELYGISCPEISKEPDGKPFFPSLPGLHFSVSHTGGHVLAVLGDAPCGCDIELVRPIRESAVRFTCAPEELADFGFFELWTLKESFFKLHGSLPRPFWESRFSRADGHILTPESGVNAALYPVTGCACAICSGAQLPEGLTFIPANKLI